MSKPAQTMIYRLAAACVLLLALAFVLPRFVDTGQGLAGATGAVMVFLAILVVACIFSVFLLLRTLRAYSALPTAARIAGILPGVLLVTGLIVLVSWLRV
jgi:threonine/homoserine/homoserine lactone efflux protein